MPRTQPALRLTAASAEDCDPGRLPQSIDPGDGAWPGQCTALAMALELCRTQPSAFSLAPAPTSDPRPLPNPLLAERPFKVPAPPEHQLHATPRLLLHLVMSLHKTMVQIPKPTSHKKDYPNKFGNFFSALSNLFKGGKHPWVMDRVIFDSKMSLNLLKV